MDRNEEQNGRVQLKFTEKTVPLELTAEFVLPDYRSEISRLLWVRPTFLPPTRFVGGGKADFSGGVHYEALYAGPDGQLYSTDLEDSYAFSVPLDTLAGYDTAAGVEMTAELTTDAVVSRVAAPRKLSVRCRLHARVCGYAVKDLTPHTVGAPAEEIERLCAVAENGRLFTGGSETFELAESVPVEMSGDLRVIDAHGAVLLPEVSALSDGVRCRGEAVLTFLVCREGSEEQALPVAITRRIPFEREVALEGVLPDCHARATGTVGGIRTAVEEGKLHADAQLVLAVEAQSEEPVLVTHDLFTPKTVAECRFSEEPLWRACGCGNRHFSVAGEVPTEGLSIPAGADVLDAVAEAEVRERTADGGRTVVAGELRCHTLYHGGGEYGVADFSIPFRTVLEDGGEDLALSCWVPLCRVTAANGALRADAEVQVAMRAARVEPQRVLCEARFTPASIAPRADLEICYPSAGETLWDVSKRYGVSPETLASANGISAEAPGDARSLVGTKYLMIP